MDGDVVMEKLKRGDRVRVVHVYDSPYGHRLTSCSVGEVILVDGIYVQVFYKDSYGARTRRYHAKSAEELFRSEIVLRPARDAETEGWGSSVRVERVA